MALPIYTPAGLLVIVGKNARENDRLWQEASVRDLWFHASGFAGAHVVIRVPLSHKVSEECKRFAAGLAWEHSKSVGSNKKPIVDSCLCCDLRKPRGATPGSVLLPEGFETIRL